MKEEKKRIQQKKKKHTDHWRAADCEMEGGEAGESAVLTSTRRYTRGSR